MNPLDSLSRGVWIHNIHLINSLRSSKKKKKTCTGGGSGQITIGDTMVSRRHEKVEAIIKQKEVSREERKLNKVQLEGFY